MRVLKSVRPTPEQLRIISKTTAGIEVIRGAAGSGKTTTAILRLRGLSGIFLNRRKSTDSKEPVRTLILTFNRTLRGYVQQLALEQAQIGEQIELEVDTFAKWAHNLLKQPRVAAEKERKAKIRALGSHLSFDSEFLCDEVDYICGLYMPHSRKEYNTAKREGRGAAPRVDRESREKILSEVIVPYDAWKKSNGFCDWGDMEAELAQKIYGKPYDIIIVDETQDFSANQVRALLRHAAKESAITFILDAAQRIYARWFTWAEVGIKLTQNNSHRLELNYRNTAQIAAFAAPIIEGITSGDVDATIPNLKGCTRKGELPIVLIGRFSSQIAYAIDFIRRNINLADDSVAFLHPAGWFDETRKALARAGLPFVEMAGAIMGYVASEVPVHEIEDKNYIITQAERMASISIRTHTEQTSYPNLLSWKPPKSQQDSVVQGETGLEVLVLGRVVQEGEKFEAKTNETSLWQWLSLESGQTVLAKRRKKPFKISEQQKTVFSMNTQQTIPKTSVSQVPLSFIPTEKPPYRADMSMDIDDLSKRAINSQFNPSIIGEHILLLSSLPGGVEKAIAYAAIIAKARLARVKHRS